MATDLHILNYGVEKGEIQRWKVIKSEQLFQHKNNTQLAMIDSSLSSRTSCSAGFFSFPWVEVQRCGANSENQGGGWLGAGEEVLGADGEHAPQEGGSC